MAHAMVYSRRVHTLDSSLLSAGTLTVHERDGSRASEPVRSRYVTITIPNGKARPVKKTSKWNHLLRIVGAGISHCCCAQCAEIPEQTCEVQCFRRNHYPGRAKTQVPGFRYNHSTKKKWGVFSALIIWQILIFAGAMKKMLCCGSHTSTSGTSRAIQAMILVAKCFQDPSFLATH